MDNYKDVVGEYQRISVDVSNRIITLSLTVIGAIFVICDKYGAGKLYLCTLIGLVLTIGAHLLKNVCNLRHYELVLDGKIKDCDYRNSIWGKLAEILFWVFLGLFLFSMVLFIVALIHTINVLNSKAILLSIS